MISKHSFKFQKTIVVPDIHTIPLSRTWFKSAELELNFAARSRKISTQSRLHRTSSPRYGSFKLTVKQSPRRLGSCSIKRTPLVMFTELSQYCKSKQNADWILDTYNYSYCVLWQRRFFENICHNQIRFHTVLIFHVYFNNCQ